MGFRMLSMREITQILEEQNLQLAELLIDKQAKIVTAESLTAGLLAASLANLPGASRYLLGGYVCYTDAMKQELLNVPVKILEDDGAVSVACVRSMAKQSLKKVKAAHIAIALSGFAGPDSKDWSEKEPCGTVYMAIAWRRSLEEKPTVEAYKCIFPPKRNELRLLVCAWAMRELNTILQNW